MHVEISIDFQAISPARLEIKDTINEVKYGCPITCGNIHKGLEWFSDYSRGKQEIFMCLAVVLCEQFCPIRERRCQDIDQVLLHEIIFFLSQCIQQR